MTTFAGFGVYGFKDGSFLSGQFAHPMGLAIDLAAETIYVADSRNNCVRRLAAGSVTTVVGSSIAGKIDGSGSYARFHFPTGLVIDPAVNILYVSDSFNHLIRSYSFSTGILSTLAGEASGFIFFSEFNLCFARRKFARILRWPFDCSCTV